MAACPYSLTGGQTVMSIRTSERTMKKKESTLPLRLLVVDSHEEVRRCLVHYMQSMRGLTVVGEARDGVEAIWKAKQTCPDLVLIGARLPRIDAWTTAIAIKARCPNAHLIALEIVTVPDHVSVPPVVESYLEKGHIVKELPNVIATVRNEMRRSRMNRVGTMHG